MSKFVFVVFSLFFSFSISALEPSSKLCWQQTQPEDLDSCLMELQVTINNTEADLAIPERAKKLEVKNLKVYKKRLEEIQKRRGKVERVRRTEARSRSVAAVVGCSDMFVHSNVSGEGWGLGRMVVRLINNTGGVIERVVTPRGVIIEKICPGASVTFNLTTGGNTSQNFSVSAETTSIDGGVRRLSVWQMGVNLYYTSPPFQRDWELTQNNKTNQR